MDKPTRFYLAALASIVLFVMFSLFLGPGHWHNFFVVAFGIVPTAAAITILSGDPLGLPNTALNNILCPCLVALLSIFYYGVMLAPGLFALEKMKIGKDYQTRSWWIVSALLLLQLAFVAIHIVFVVHIRAWIERID